MPEIIVIRKRVLDIEDAQENHSLESKPEAEHFESLIEEGPFCFHDGNGHHGLNMDGYYRNGYDRQGFKRDGYNRQGYDRNGFNRNGIDREGFDKSGFNAIGRDREGYDKDGYNLAGYNRQGFDRSGIDREGFDKSGFNIEGFNRNGFNRDGYDREGYDSSGYNINCINREGFISHAKWHEILASITHPPSYQNEWSAEESYCEINDQDFALASEWANAEKDDNFTMARMLSARTAEKIAAKFYQSLGYEVNDVSIKQTIKEVNNPTSSNSNDWKLYDLLLNNEISVDVKNARTPLNSEMTYVEHCVSRFKKNRTDQNVIIAGVLSPYLKLDYIQNPDHVRYEATIKYLGETTISNFIRLEDRFSKRFLKLSLNSMNFIPRWLFEFPEIFYATRNQQRSILQRVAIEQVPTIANCEKAGVNPIPAYLASGINLPEAWKTDLKDWQIYFYSRIRPRDNSVVTMPVLFLALLVHFLEAVTQDNNWNEYEPENYRQLLYAELPANENLQMPLGIFDPLGTIESFIETLSILWSNKEHTNLREFELFKFNGVGLLEGKRLNKQKYETILAYCGGFIEGKGKCGNNPLILGKHESCPACGKLICEQCGHCSATCQQCEKRMKSMSNSSDFSTTERSHHDINNSEENPFEGEIPF